MGSDLTPVVVIHAGAAPERSIVVEQAERCRAALVRALESAGSVLEDGGSAVDAVQSAITVMEDFELFNAGHGAVLCADGSVELSAALMTSDRQAGAVAGISRTRNPITGARAVYDSDQVLVIGAAADALAAMAGVATVEPGYFVTERQRERLHAHRNGPEHATVGAVALAADGTLAAGTSTGGIRAQPPGRVGDCPQIGAGTWADSRVAVSCTGDGEAFIRSGVARYIAALVEAGVPVQQAADRALDDVAAVGGEGGLIAVDGQGRIALPYLTSVMPRGVWRGGEGAAAYIGER
jgi:beta-aspartyl-peptidase (threonine type)